MWQRESRRSGEGKEKNNTGYNYCTSRLPPLVCLRDVILCHAFNVSQSDLPGINTQNVKNTFEHSIKSYEQIYAFKCLF